MRYLEGMGTEVITIREAQRADISAIDGMLGKSYARLLKNSYRPSTMVTAVPLISRANPRLILSGSYYVAADGEGRVVGAGGWTPIRKNAATAEIRHFVTDHRRVREGIGRYLMETVLAKARGAGMERAFCFATRNAVPFYEAMGFLIIGPGTANLRPGIEFPVMRMERWL